MKKRKKRKGKEWYRLDAYLPQKREEEVRLVHLPGLLHLARIEDCAERLGCKLLRGAIDIDATEKYIHKLGSQKSFGVRKDNLQSLCNQLHHSRPFTLHGYADGLSN